jgi:RHS repeat-associated protein
MCAYTTYGAPTCQSSGAGAPSTPVGYEDGYTDPTGLVYLINRYYDPSLRQFISVDPAYSQTHSLYGYVGSDPVNGSDPSGLAPYS